MTGDPRHLRPTGVSLLQADPSKANRRLGWEPMVTFRDMVRIMMDAELQAAGLPAPGEGNAVSAQRASGVAYEAMMDCCHAGRR